MKKIVPNFFTFSNLFLGILGISILMDIGAEEVKSGGIYIVSILILIAALCDFFDGLFARLLNVESIIGKELDSFADLTTFGVLPAFIVFKLLKTECNLYTKSAKDFYHLMLYVPLFMPCFTAYRLARFNVKVAENKNFIGLPSTISGIFIAFIPLLQKFSKNILVKNILVQPKTLILFTISLCILMVCDLNFFSLKLNSVRWRDNKIPFCIIFISICMILVFNVDGVFFSLCVYIIGSIISNYYKSK